MLGAMRICAAVQSETPTLALAFLRKCQAISKHFILAASTISSLETCLKPKAGILGMFVSLTLCYFLLHRRALFASDLQEAN